MLIRRSTLILPVNVPRFVAKAHERGADAVCLDLEDSILPSQKETARAALPSAIKQVGRRGADVLVRINHPWELAPLDLDAAVAPGVAGIVLPKVESAADVYALDHLILERELARGLTPGAIHLCIKLESARGLLRAEEICSASPRVATISPGTEDFATDLGVELSDDGTELLYSRAKVVVVAAAYGVEPTGLLGRTSDYRDLDGFRRSALRARRLGYRGASCIHPDQVAVLNDVFRPSAEEVARAQRIVDSALDAAGDGNAAFSVDGRMADPPTVTRARNLLGRAAEIATRDARNASLSSSAMEGKGTHG
jgi:citrate lyase subunit beta / citryl-CoA lyase